MASNKVKQIHEFGQSIWLDFIDRKIINTGELKKLVEEDGVRGVTSNPAIFEKAISSSSDYDADISALSKGDKTNEEIFFGLAVNDIKLACDLLRPVYDEAPKGGDGYVSLEVFDLAGKKIKTLLNGQKNSGIYTYNLNTRNGYLQPGTYAIKLYSAGKQAAQKFVVAEK